MKKNNAMNTNTKSTKTKIDKNLIWAMVTIIIASLFFYFGFETGKKSNKDTAPSDTTSQTNTTEDKKEVVEKPKFEYVLNSSFVLGPDKKIIKNTENISNKKTIFWYQDPHCPACVKLEMLMSDKIEDILHSELYIRYFPLAFMNAKSTDNYSLRASTYILSAAEKAPGVAYKFMLEVFSEDFYPKQNEPKSDKEFRDAFVRAGGTAEQWDNILDIYEVMSKEVVMKTAQVSNDAEMIKKSPYEKLTIPIVLIGDSDKTVDFGACEDAVDCFVNGVSEYNKMITSEKKPISLDGLLDNYEVGSTLKVTVKSDIEFSKVRWKIKYDDNSEVALHNDKPTLEYVITQKDRGSYIVVQTINSEGNVIESLESKINIKEEGDK